MDVGRLQGSRKQRGVVGADEVFVTIHVAELECANDFGGNGLELQVGKMFSNAAVTTSAEGEVRRGRTLADEAVAVVDLLLIIVAVAGDSGSVRGVGLPSVRIPLVGIGEVRRVGSADTGSGEKVVRGGNDILRSGNGHGRLHGAQDGVNRGVQAEGLLDNGLVQGELGEILVLQRREVSAEGIDLLLIELLHDLRVLSKTEHDPRAGGRRRVLASHEEGNHHVGDLVVGDTDAVLVGGVHQVLHHVVLGLIAAGSTALLDGVHVDFGNGSLGAITAAVPGERSPMKSEVDGSEAHIEIVVEVSESLVELVSDGAALESMGGGKDGNFGHLLGDIDNTRLALEVGALLEVVADLARDDGDVGSEGLGGESNLHELKGQEIRRLILSKGWEMLTFFCSMSLALGQS